MKRNLVALLGALCLTVVGSGCGTQLNGNFTGTHTKSGGFSQSYTTTISLYQDGDRVTGNVVSNPSSGAGYNQVVTGNFEGQLEGDIIRNVRMNLNEFGCNVVYTGQFIVSGTSLSGTLVSQPTNAEENSACSGLGAYQGGTTTNGGYQGGYQGGYTTQSTTSTATFSVNR